MDARANCSSLKAKQLAVLVVKILLKSFRTGYLSIISFYTPYHNRTRVLEEKMTNRIDGTVLHGQMHTIRCNARKYFRRMDTFRTRSPFSKD